VVLPDSDDDQWENHEEDTAGELSEVLPRLSTAAKPNPRLPDRPLEMTLRTRKQRGGGSGGVGGG